MLPVVGVSSARMSFDVVVLPQPDSPTTLSVEPAGMAKETPTTARTTPVEKPRPPRRTRKCLVRFETSSTGVPFDSGLTMKPAARRVAGRDRDLRRRLGAAIERRGTARRERAPRVEPGEVGWLTRNRRQALTPHAEARDRLEQR